MQALSPGSLRYRVLETAKRFKSSWIDLGRHLYTVYRDKHFREWGYLTFEAYCAQELGIRKATGVKLLKSYSFLETDEPAYLKRQETAEASEAPRIPSLESVNALRLAKTSGRIQPAEYKRLREDVLEEAKDEADVRKKIRYILKSAPGASGQAAAPDPKTAAVRRLAQHLRADKTELERAGAPAKLVASVDSLLELLADYLR